jgi:hypothetical protein
VGAGAEAEQRQSRGRGREGREDGDVRLETDADGSLQDGRDHKGPGPSCGWDVHSGSAAGGRRQGGGKAFAVVVAPRGRCGVVVAVGIRLLGRVLGKAGVWLAS